MRSPRRSSPRARPRPLTVAVATLAVFAALAGQARAGNRPGPGEGPGAVRRRIEAVDARISRIQTRLGEHAGASNRATWLLFKANRTLDLARLELRDARRWGPPPDELRLSALGPTPQEQGVADARSRLRTLRSSRRVGGAVALDARAGARLDRLELARAQLEERLGTLEEARPWGAGTPDAGEWATAFLARIGAPDCTENRVLMVAWEAQESTEARFNPLATTHDMPGATDFNDVGVKNYRSVGQGLDATSQTLAQGSSSYGYEAILSSLRACNDAEATAWFVNASAWCRGCTAGAYLTALLPVVRADLATYSAR
jgi:hypothetical protein